jgi:uncharacterized protein (TIGR00159 family)
MLDVVGTFRWQDGVDILLIAFITYRIILLIKGTRAVQMMAGLVVVLVAFILSRIGGFLTLHWILDNFLASFILVIVVIFQEDIRRALARVGRTPFFASSDTLSELQVLESVIKSAQTLAEKKIGALLVLERETGLRNYIERGVPIDAQMSKEMIVSIFHPDSPLHDGAVIIEEGRIAAAGCLLPLSANPHVSRAFGTRHRAGLGLSEKSDAVVLIVSEETGAVSLAFDGRIRWNVKEATLRETLLDLLPLEKRGNRLGGIGLLGLKKGRAR